MRSQWVICLVIAGFAYVSANKCDIKCPEKCYDDLVTYETLTFPLYGNNETELDTTCGNINMALYCIHSYAEICQGSEECDEKCKNLISEIRDFLKVTGLIKLANNLCQENSPLRQTYLENIECLENHRLLYAACHSDSEASQHYMHNTKEASTVESRCCYLSWYKDCFTNITRDNCGENASNFMSVGVHNLLGNIADQLCVAVDIHCDKPPLPPEGTEDGHGLDKDKRPDDHVIAKDKEPDHPGVHSDKQPDIHDMDKQPDYSCMDKFKKLGDDHDMDKDKQPDDHDMDKDTQPDHDIDKNKSNETDNDVDNSLDKNTAMIKSHSAVIMVLSFIFFMLYCL